MLLLIDNYDSFTYNLYQYLSELGADIEVRRNDQVTLEEIKAMEPDHIVVSPGPCTPNEAGLSCQIIETFGPFIPTLGVCLGHQAIGQVYGGQVIRASGPMHGKTSLMYHQGQGIFRNLPVPFEANRYHSLIVERNTLPAALEITAETADGIIMGLRHRTYPVEGVQFHPESILTPVGKDLLRNFLYGREIDKRCGSSPVAPRFIVGELAEQRRSLGDCVSILRGSAPSRPNESERGARI